MTGAPIIVLDRVSKNFGDVRAVEELSLTINEGEFITFLGPSGCGKSTALKMIAGLMPLTAGTITISAPTSDAEHDLGFVFQEPTLMPWASVFDNVYLPLRLADIGLGEATPRVREALREVGLTRFAEAYPRELSGGMKMRVSIARALVTRPRILLMDEPFAALDEMTRSKLNDDLVKLSDDHGLTVVFVTHSVFESVYLSTRVIVMAARPGRLVADTPLAAPWPRKEEYRTSLEFSTEARRISETLKGTLDVDDIDH
ncbi:MAG: ABC transporter ATP-binding protein [Rhodobacter sp.]|nr:ABC transporter ATP-binding protein [Rhodobacter sp.]MCY4168435.1 ABC transporter ATP-binding protein [Rhodobacter sp.]